MGMSEPDGHWVAWRSLNDSRASSAESYAKNQPAESPRPRKNRYGVPRYNSPDIIEMCNKVKKIIIIASLLLSVNVSLTRAVTDDKLKEYLSQKYEHILKEAELDRQNDPNSYKQRLELMDGCLQRAAHVHGGMRISIYPPPFLQGRGVRWRVGPNPLGPKSVPFLLEILIKGPPLHANGMWKDPDFQKIRIEFNPQVYDLWARCWATTTVCEYNHPSILPFYQFFLVSYYN